MTSPLPNFDNAVSAVLHLIGVSPVLIAAVLLAFALESWYSNAKRMARAAVVTSGAVRRGSAWVARQRPAQVAATLLTTGTVLAAQAIMIRVSYVGGSIVATP
ncbi:hypothetical protein ACQPZF_17215 [Actinosynnema sp. CS-041913]|uniref:hypothetical protein n=1 Tax=Actinosynnema sp. CS-041913 TaxID=3239917 RepID=UPI003D942E17